MARQRYGCAVVIERGKVAGIFTVTDALRLVSALAPTEATPTIAPRRASRRPAAHAD
jgi:CBS domain-containing protein